MRPLIVLLCTLSLSGFVIDTAYAKERASSKQCARWQKQLTGVENRLRRGYTAKQGNTLRAKQRKLRSKLHSHCK